MTTPIKPDGIVTFKPHDKAPSFVKGTVIITLNKFFEFCKSNPDFITEYKGEKQIKCQLLEGDYGIYLAVDTYKKSTDNKENKSEGLTEYENGNPNNLEDDTEIPF